jgi:glycosyltransferase involved in cell wall biosynthesis
MATNMYRDYPKVLIIGQSFDRITGGGITLSNLFAGWDRNRIAVVSFNIDTTQTSICTNCYQIGNDEKRWCFPFNYLERKVVSGSTAYSKQHSDTKHSNTQVVHTKLRQMTMRELLKNTFLSSLHFIGIYNVLYELRVSERFIAWVQDFKPDMIYTQLSTLALIRFIDELHRLIGVPIAIHIMDDWPETIASRGMLSVYWKKVIDREFRALIYKSSVLMSISQAMNEQYKIRYGQDFIPFHNPINLSHWSRYSKADWSYDGTFKILYAGRVGLGVYNALLDIVEAVDRLIDLGYDIIIEIQSTNLSEQAKRRLQGFKNVIINPILRYEQLPQKLTSMDLLVIPMDFDLRGLKFIRLSMPTKASEYMASGTPVLVYAPEETALSIYAKNERWGYVVNSRCSVQLCNAIKELYSNKPLREKLGSRALELAQKNHDAVEVRKEFHKVLIDCLTQRKKGVLYGD